MNTVQLECFLTVAEYLNFSKASEALKLTQPAVTHQIQSLEKELDVKLFRRTSKNVSLTQEGYLFLADAQLILKTAISARERLGNHEHFLPLELGCHNQAELRFLPPVLHDLYEEYPLLRPNIRLIPLPSLMNMLENNQLDAALGLRENRKKSSLYYKELCMARYACICAPEHPAARYDSLTTGQLSEAGNFIACTPRPVPDSFFSVQNHLLSNLPRPTAFSPTTWTAPSLLSKRRSVTPSIRISRLPETGTCAIFRSPTCQPLPSASTVGRITICRC